MCKCYMIAPTGQVWKEDRYEGYGEFGGKDVFVVCVECNPEKFPGHDIAKMSEKEKRDLFFNQRECDLDKLEGMGWKTPRITGYAPKVKDGENKREVMRRFCDELPATTACTLQGSFHCMPRRGRCANCPCCFTSSDDSDEDESSDDSDEDESSDEDGPVKKKTRR